MGRLDVPQTLVMEMLLQENVGKDEKSVSELRKYFAEAVEIIGGEKNGEPSIHLSETYGQSGWVTFLRDGSLGESEIDRWFIMEQAKIGKNKKPGAGHLYAWDYENDSDGIYKPFVTIDFTTEGVESSQLYAPLLDHAQDFFKATDIAYKFSSAPEAETWKELAPHIIRQRLEFGGQLKNQVSEKEIENYLLQLAPKLGMIPAKNARPKIRNHPESGIIQAWYHWETSGVHLTVDRNTNTITIQIYTCKDFSDADAIKFTKSSFPQISFFKAGSF